MDAAQPATAQSTSPRPAQRATTPPAEPDYPTVSLRELNQRSGRIVAAVAQDNAPVTITDRGKPVARIVPLSYKETGYERLVREGRLRPARGTWPKERPIPPFPVPPNALDLLFEEREEER